MSNIDTTIANIEAKVRRVVEERDRLGRLVERQEATIVELQNNINQNNLIINTLKEEITKLTTTRNAPTEISPAADIEPRIERLIAIIDESLALLGYNKDNQPLQHSQS